MKFSSATVLIMIESLLILSTLCLYKHYVLQVPAMVRNFDVLKDLAIIPAIDVTAIMIVVITVTNNIMVSIS